MGLAFFEYIKIDSCTCLLKSCIFGSYGNMLSIFADQSIISQLSFIGCFLQPGKILKQNLKDKAFPGLFFALGTLITCHIVVNRIHLSRDNNQLIMGKLFAGLNHFGSAFGAATFLRGRRANINISC